MNDDHLAVGPEPVLLLDADPDQRLDGGAPRDAPHHGHPAPAPAPPGLLVQRCNEDIFFKIKMIKSR